MRILPALCLVAVLAACTGDGATQPEPSYSPAAKPPDTGVSVSGYARVGVVYGG